MRPPLPANTISAVIPAYNREETIERAIESVLAQTRPPDEIIVVDDGSTDRTAGMVHGFGPQVQYLRQENSGASEARNRGVHAASGRWIAFLDSDDWWQPEHLDRIERAITATDGRAPLYFANLRQTPERGGRLLWDVAGFQIEGPFELTQDATAWAMLPVQPMMLQSSVVLRSRLLEVGGLWPKLRCRHDTHLFFKLGLSGPACAVAGCGAVQTSDDREGGRVTERFGSGSDSFSQDTVALYHDILARPYRLSRRQRADLRSRLASRHLRLAREAFRRRRLGAMLHHALSAAARSPSRVLDGAIRRSLNPR